ncbi:MAG TPA: prepilin-type N-terminal cleavage/methylation domain-containing protein, partial [Burkholderiaceae bacterium]|nr:prepilin-type N-terminal cleavage/methylation domain-containing protein [Burkholderiaceae bacterium]
MMMRRPTLREKGFTLAEAVIVIVITGIIAGTVAVFLRLPVQGYVDTAARAELTDIADTALRRMTRD